MKVLIAKYKREPYYQGPELMTWDNSNVNLGFSKAVNKLVAASDPEDVVFMNDDVIPLDDCLTVLKETAYSDATIGMVGAKQMFLDGRTYTTGHDHVKKFGIGPVQISGRRDYGETEPVDVPGVDFACAYVKRQVIREIGPLDEWFFHGVEEVDYCMSASEAGWRLVYNPKARCYHVRQRRRFYVKQRVMPDYYHCYAKHHHWKMMLDSMILNLLGIPASVKSRNVEYLMVKMRGLVPV